MYNLLCFIKTEAQIPRQNKVHLQSIKWTNMKDAYKERFLMQIMLLGSFCQLRNSKTNLNVLLDLSKLLEKRKRVVILSGQNNNYVVQQAVKLKFPYEALKI